MIRIEFDGGPVQTVRLATSPLWEAVAGLSLLAKPAATAIPYAKCMRSIRARLSLTVREDAAAWFRDLSEPYPPFLTPVPRTAWPSFDEQLAVLSHTDPAIARRTLT